jgi:DNA polymerase I
MFRFQKPPTHRVENPSRGILLDATYRGDSNSAVLYFLNPEKQTYFRWMDNTGHTSYLLTDAEIEEIGPLLGDDPDYSGLDIATKYDSIRDKYVDVTKVLASNPNAIGGAPSRYRSRNFRDILTEAGHNVWEARIRYVNNYCYDTNIEMGMSYTVTKNKIETLTNESIKEQRNKVLKVVTEKTPYTDMIDHWVRLSEEPIPFIKCASLDIEVLPETPTSMPNANIATQPVITTSFVTSDNRKIIYMLKRIGTAGGEGMFDGDITFFDDEKSLLQKTFDTIDEYPFIITFNGDSFDMLYLFNRAMKLGFNPQKIPVYVIQKTCKLSHGVHVDLYPFIKNPSIQNYAFKEKYKEFTLEAVSQGLLGKGKLKFDKFIESLSYVELANYCVNDAQLTYELFTFGNHTMFNLIIVLMRMANLSIYQITRNKISDWVLSTMFYIMRRRNWLIPNTEDLLSKGENQTKSKVKGKNYEGAIVKEPKTGIFFNVVVVDFASLYPSEVKERNIGFNTINCKHKECMDATGNHVPGTTHYLCKKNKALEADVIGGLKDVRVYYYKQEAKNKSNPLSNFYKVLEQALKVYINAAYGVFGSPSFQLLCPPVAESIAAFARHDITAVMNKAEEIGADNLYCDTDSDFLNNPTVEQTEKLKDFARLELKLDLEVDKVYKYAIFSTRKKNYLGVYKDGTVDIKGMTGKKKHTPPIIKKPFYAIIEVLKSINTMDDYEGAKTKIEAISKDSYNQIKNRKWKLEDLAYSVRMTKDIDQYMVNSQHVKVAKLLEEMGVPVKGGDNIEFIKATNEQGVMPVMGAEPAYVDTESYLEELGSALSQILDCVEIEWSKIEGITTLDMFVS